MGPMTPRRGTSRNGCGVSPPHVGAISGPRSRDSRRVGAARLPSLLRQSPPFCALQPGTRPMNPRFREWAHVSYFGPISGESAARVRHDRVLVAAPPRDALIAKYSHHALFPGLPTSRSPQDLPLPGIGSRPLRRTGPGDRARVRSRAAKRRRRPGLPAPGPLGRAYPSIRAAAPRPGVSGLPPRSARPAWLRTRSAARA